MVGPTSGRDAVDGLFTDSDVLLIFALVFGRDVLLGEDIVKVLGPVFPV
jgi:hypothetical protein